MKSLRFLLLALLAVASMFLLCSCESDPDETEGGDDNFPFVDVSFDYTISLGDTVRFANVDVTTPTTAVPEVVSLLVNGTPLNKTIGPNTTGYTHKYVFDSVPLNPGTTYQFAIIVDSDTVSTSETITSAAVINKTAFPDPYNANVETTLQWSWTRTPVMQAVIRGQYTETDWTSHERKTYRPAPTDESFIIAAWDPTADEDVVCQIAPDRRGIMLIDLDTYYAKVANEKVTFAYVCQASPLMIQANGAVTAPPYPQDSNIDRSKIFAEIAKSLRKRTR